MILNLQFRFFTISFADFYRRYYKNIKQTLKNDIFHSNRPFLTYLSNSKNQVGFAIFKLFYRFFYRF